MYILYILFQLKSHSYLYASIPQQIIDEESHPGVLADFMHHHSSDSFSSSSDDSDDSATSISTAKRIKRAMRHRIRRKSSISSKETVSRQSVRKRTTVEAAPVVTIEPNSGSNTNSGDETAFSAVDFVDETPYHADEDTPRFGDPRSRDFGQKPIVGKTPRDDQKARKQKGRVGLEATNRIGALSSANISQRTSLTSCALQPSVGHSQLGNNAELVADMPQRRSPFLPAIPSLLSNTVFSNSQTPSNVTQSAPLGAGRRLRRSNSLPTRMNRAPVVGSAVQFARGAARISPTTPVAAVEPPPLHPEADMSRTAAVVMLLISTGLVAVCAEFLVDAIPGMIEDSTVSQAFIGLIILPIVGNAAEHVTAVSVATKNKMDLAIGVSVGSSIQIGKHQFEFESDLKDSKKKKKANTAFR